MDSLLNALLRPLRRRIVKTARYDRLRAQLDALLEAQHERASALEHNRQPTAAGIVFSRDRALQLDGLLRSYAACVDSAAPLHLQYSCSSDAHAAAYREVVSRAGVAVTTARREEHFRQDLLNTLEHLEDETVFFLVDDIVFTRRFNLATLTSLPLDTCVPSMRLGGQLTYCYTRSAEQPLPAFGRVQSADTSLLSWRWADGEMNWGYPLSLDGHLFSRVELLRLMQSLTFTAPNSLESALQKHAALYRNRLGVCFEQSVLMNMPINRVQTEYDNHSADVTADSLLQAWQAGRQLDIGQYRDYRNKGAHEECELHLQDREDA